MKLILILLILFSMTLSNAQNIDKVLHRVNVITMTDDKILYDYSVLISEALILDIIPSRKFKPGKFPTAEVFELNDKYVMPALADMHMHSSGFNEEAFNVYLSYGITTLRFMVGDDNLLRSNPENILKPDYPDIIMAGDLIDGDPPSWGEQHTGPIITKLEDVRPEVERQIEKGYDLIKLYPRLTKDVYEEFLNYTYARGFKLSGHVPVTVDTSYFFNPKMQEIQHLSGYGRYCTTLDSISSNVFYYDLNYDKKFARQYCLEKIERAARKAVQNNVWNCPTLGFNYFQHDEKYRKALDQQRLGGKLEGLLGWWSTSEVDSDELYYFDFLKQVTGALYRNNAKILAGTDFPLFYLVPGLSIHQELELFVECGFSNFDAIKTATTNPAEWFGNGYNKGYVAKGKQADLIILNKNPLDNIKNTQSIYKVIFKGNIVEDKPPFFY